MTVRFYCWPGGTLSASAIFLGVFLALFQTAHAQLRIVNYNTLDKPFNSTHDDQLTTIFTALEMTPVNGIAKRVDVMALSEQTNSGGNNTALRIAGLFNSHYGVSSYTYAVSGTGSDNLAFVYDTASVQLLDFDTFDLGTRPAAWLQVQPVGYTGTALNLFSVHLKAGSTGSDISIRQSEVGVLRTFAASINETPDMLYMGDFNFGDSGEAGHVDLIADGIDSISKGIDPLNQPSWPNSSPTVSKILTQSTRTTNTFGDGGATGGIDDRFDLQYSTSSLLDGEGLSYLGPTSTGLGGLQHSYRAFGNDGTSYNLDIVLPTSGRSQSATVLDALQRFSDHLPVVADYQLPAKMDAVAGSVPQLSVGQTFNLDVTVSNIANVVAAVGADELNYSVTTSGNISGSFANQVALALAGGNTHFVSLDTSTPGMKSGFITVSSSSQQVQGGLIQIPISYEVIDGNEPPPPGPEVVAATWTFETSQPTLSNQPTISNIAPEEGIGTAGGVHTSTATDYSSPSGNGSPESFSSNTWNVGAYYEFQISTEGFQDISISFDQASSNTGPRDFEIFWGTSPGGPFTTTGETYTVLANDMPNPVWNPTTHLDEFSFEFDFSNITALDDQETMILRLVDTSSISANGGAVATGGTSRVDNFTIYYHSMPGLPGDFNADGTVDAADYVMWRKDNGVGSYADWAENFGASLPGSGGDGDGGGSVPEPGAGLLAAVGICLLAARRGKLATWTSQR